MSDNEKAPERIHLHLDVQDHSQYMYVTVDGPGMVSPIDADYIRADLVERMIEERVDQYLPDAVNEKLEEMNKDAASFDKDLWRQVRNLLDGLDFPWRDYDNEVTAYDVTDWLGEHIRHLEEDAEGGRDAQGRTVMENETTNTSGDDRGPFPNAFNASVPGYFYGVRYRWMCGAADCDAMNDTLLDPRGEIMVCFRCGQRTEIRG